MKDRQGSEKAENKRILMFADIEITDGIVEAARDAGTAHMPSMGIDDEREFYKDIVTAAFVAWLKRSPP